MARKYSNTFAETTLTGSISNSATTIQIGSTAGLPVSFPFTLAIDYGTASVEMVTVTALAGSNLTVVRGQDGTSAQAHSAGARVVHPVSARDLSEPQIHMDATSDVHGLTGGASVVGTSQAQTLTNKTISGSANTLSNIGNASIVDLAAAKVTQPFATMTVTGSNGAAQVLTVTGSEGSRTTPVATIRRNTVGLAVDEDGVVDVNSDLSVGTTRVSGAAALTSRLYILATTKVGAIIQRVASQSQDLFQIVTEASANLFRVSSAGNVTAAGSVTAGTSLGAASAAITGAATVGTTLGVTGLLTASGGASVTGGVTATGTVQGATVTSTGAVNGASAAITGGIVTGNTGVSVSGETWHAMTLANGWTNFGSGFVTAKYRRVAGPANTVEIVGVIGGGTPNTVIFTLPSGYRPAASVRELVYLFAPGGSIATETPGVTVAADGTITLIGTSNATIVGFHCFIPLDA